MNGQSDTPGRTFAVVFTESEMSRVIASLWREEHRQLGLARIAAKQARPKEAVARRETAAEVLALSERLSIIGVELA